MKKEEKLNRTWGIRDAGFDRIIVWDSENFNGMRDLPNYSVGFGKL